LIETDSYILVAEQLQFKTLYISSKKKINEQISKEALSILEKDNNTYEELENHLSKLDDVVDLSSLDENTNYLIHNTRTKVIETLANGVITENDLSQVNYELEDKDHSSKEKYLNITIPKFGTVIAPYRQKKINLRGYSIILPIFRPQAQCFNYNI